MSRIAPRQDTEHVPCLVRRESTDGITADVSSIRPERPVLTDPREPHTISNHSIVWAITGLVTLGLSFVSR